MLHLVPTSWNGCDDIVNPFNMRKLLETQQKGGYSPVSSASREIGMSINPGRRNTGGGTCSPASRRTELTIQ